MTDINPHTGARLTTKALTQQGRDNWDKIFPPKEKKDDKDSNDRTSFVDELFSDKPSKGR